MSATVTRGGIAAKLLVPGEDGFSVAPTTGDGHNTIRQGLRPTASWRIDSHRFHVGSSLVLPATIDEFAILGALHPPSPKDGPDDAPKMAIFGHADATGSDADNKVLSGRRAKSVYALLVRSVDLWEALYSGPKGSDHWGVRGLRVMLAALGFPSGAVSNDFTPAAREAVRRFQERNSLPVDGHTETSTRKVLFANYMDLICTKADGTPLVYRAQDFVIAGQDSEGKGAYQGCSDFNLLVVPAKKRVDLLNRPEHHAERDEEYGNNRRVVIYMFPSELKISPDRWPCPRASESADGCKKMFWQDGDKRRKPADRHREHGLHDGTFACRFYDSFARFSPTERTRRTVPVYLLDRGRKRMPGVPFRAIVDGSTIDGVSDSEGRALIEGALVGREFQVEWGTTAVPGVFAHHAKIVFDPEDGPSDDEGRAAARLRNLGYHHGNLHADLVAFQSDHGLAKNPWPDPETRDLLYAAHVGGKERSVDAEDGHDIKPSHETLGRDATR